VDDLGPALPLGLRLAGHGADHLRGQSHVAHLDDGHLDSPGLGGLVDDLLQLLVELLALA
jgi:hypothetical protein